VAQPPKLLHLGGKKLDATKIGPLSLSPLTLKNRPHSPSSPCPIQPQTTPTATLPLPATPRCLPPPPPCPAFEYCHVPTVSKRSFNRYLSPTTPSASPSSIPNTLLKSCRLPILDTSSLPPLIVKRPVLLPFCWPPTTATHSPIIISYL
jgi:hypothetical protein